jgi:hypothetical protein
MIGLLLGAATIVAPLAAQAQEQGRQRGGGGMERGGGDNGGGRERGGWQRGGGDNISGGQERGGWQRGDRGAAMNESRREAVQQARESARSVERAAPVARAAPVMQTPRADVANDSARQRGGRDWNRGNDRATDGGRSIEQRRGGAAADRDRNGRNWDRDGDRNGRDGRNDGNRSWTSDRRDWDGRNWDRRDNRNWDRNWRNDRRYSWQDYRRSNRNIYRMPRYEGRHGYSYRRWSPGYRFDPFFYSSTYWISDPFYYRLPPAYGDYRWVRYYDDAVLVDVRTGEIADIIYSFFF